MGRMLETLKLGEGRRPAPTVVKPTAEAAVQDCVVDWEIGEEVPFVEVGGPNKKVELSPGLLAHPPQPAPQPPHHPVETAPALVKAPSVKLIPTKPMTVAYEVYPTVTPAPSIGADVIAYHQPDHATSKEYGVLLETMLNGLKSTGPAVLLFIGARPNVGASTVILNLGTIAAQTKGLRVALIEANGQDAGMAHRLGHVSASGLDDVLAGRVGLEQAIAKTAIPTLHVLPAGGKANPARSEAMIWLCAWMRERYDLVLIDGPTLENLDAIAVQVPNANGVYLVLPLGETAVGKGNAMQRLGGRLCGLIHTHLDM